MPKLHKILFPRLHKDALLLNERHNKAVQEINRLHSMESELDFKTKEIYRLREEIKIQKNIRKPTMADLMRECLGLLPIDFTTVAEDPSLEEKLQMSPDELEKCNKETGLPKDFLDTIDGAKRESYIAQLYTIWQLEVFPVMINYYINLQGNWTFKKAIDDTQIFAGRMSCNGIYLIKNKVKAGHDEYKDKSKPPEEFDEHELDEGFNLKNMTDK